MLWKEKWNFGLNSKLKVRLKFATGHDIMIDLNQVFSGCDADFMIIMGHGLFAAVEIQTHQWEGWWLNTLSHSQTAQDEQRKSSGHISQEAAGERT